LHEAGQERLLLIIQIVNKNQADNAALFSHHFCARLQSIASKSVQNRKPLLQSKLTGKFREILADFRLLAAIQHDLAEKNFDEVAEAAFEYSGVSSPLNRHPVPFVRDRTQ